MSKINKYRHQIGLFILMALAGISITHAQDNKRLSVFGEHAQYNFVEREWTLDINYRISDKLSFSSWHQTTQERSDIIGGDYYVRINSINWSKNEKFVLSLGKAALDSEFIKERSFMVKVRFKIY